MAPKATMPIHVRGVTYATAHEAAAALGVSLSQVYGALCRGRMDSLGVGKGRHNNHKLPCRHPVKIGPWWFASKRAAAKALGISTSWLTAMDTDPRARQYVTAAAMRYASNSKREDTHAREP